MIKIILEQIPGGALEESVVLDGVMINKDIVHPKSNFLKL